jgi:DNA-binding ferritin-like protein
MEITKRDLMEITKTDLLNGLSSKSNPTTETTDFVDMIATLLHSQTQVHIFHWQTKSQSSFSEHKALQEYYEGIDGLVDNIVESYQGKYEIITGYKTIKTVDYKSTEQVISYFKELDENIEKNRTSVKESYIQNQIDTVQELIYSTLYKLRFLK